MNRRRAGDAPLMLLHLKLVGKISLAVSALAVLALLGVLALVGGQAGESYGAMIRQYSLSRENLGAAMLVAGLLLVAFTGVVTSLIVVYSSVRVAGPLHRFGRDLRMAGTDAPALPYRTRRGDPFARQAEAIGDALATLRTHHDALELAGAAARAALTDGDAVAWRAAVAALKGVDGKVNC